MNNYLVVIYTKNDAEFHTISAYNLAEASKIAENMLKRIKNISISEKYSDAGVSIHGLI